MQVTLVCILCELLPLVDLKIWLSFFVHPRNQTLSLQPMHVCDYHFTTTFQLHLVHPINADILTLVSILCELWPLMDFQTLDKAYHIVTTTIF